MKQIILPFLLLFSTVSGYGQKDYFQQEVNFTITVSLDDKEHTLDAFESVEYINNSTDTLQFIWFHIWPNAYKNDRTAFSEQLLKARRTDFYFSKPEQKGYINQLEFKVDGSNATFVSDTNHIDVIQLLLPTPLAPGKKITITTPFKVKLPYNFSRGGHIGNHYQVTQWFPKPAVYDKRGWHPMPYLDQGEFYSEFGNFDVEITAPSAYLVAATGVLQDSGTVNELKEKGKHTTNGRSKTWRYKQNNIHDFAWFASKDFTAHHDTLALPSNKVIDVFSYYKPKSKGWDESLAYAKDGLKKYSSWIGDYPYTVATVVQGSKNETSGGMEYPTITTISTIQTGRELDATIVHELGHNWFYAALASDERTHPWMDEGMNTFYQRRYEKEKYNLSAKKKPGSFATAQPGEDDEEVLLETLAGLQKDQPIETKAAHFTTINYALVAYYKTSRWMKKLQEDLGSELFDKAMQAYYSDWKYRHPHPEDFKKSIEKTTSIAIEDHFNLIYKEGLIAAKEKKQTKISFLFNKPDTKHNAINIAPAVGVNNYDKGMLGGLVHNYGLPLPGVQYLAGVLYGTGSKRWNGFGRISYNIYQRKFTLSTAVSHISYSQNDFTTADKSTLIMRMSRWVPSVNLTFFGKDLQSTQRIKLLWKTFLINEGSLNFQTINSPSGPVDQVKVVHNSSYINRFVAEVSDNRVLFPFSVSLSTDQGKDFIRTGVTGKMFFNYADGKTGMSARLFAGKFFYLKSATNLLRFYNDRYALNMSGPKGDEDYTYSDYFVGRNEFEGWQSQQIMERDGFFKVNTELLGNKVGKTDDWLLSLNLSSDLPASINPLSILPVKIPFKIFADVGTYAEAWKNNPASGRFIYDAGIQIPFFHALIDVYIPIVYSKVYSNYYKSTITEKRFLKTIAFTININKLKMRDIIKEIPL